MITAHIVDSGRLIARELPKVGETINVYQFGKAVVIELFHNTYDNYITIDFGPGNFKTTHRFEVVPIYK